MLTADTDTDGIPATEKQKDIALKTDWKYTIEPCFNYALIPVLINKGKSVFISSSPCLPYKTGIFHPPLI